MNNRVFKLSDIYWAGIWLITKIGYLVLPVPVLIGFAKLMGWFKSLTSEKKVLVKQNLVAAFGDEWNETKIQATMRRHLEFLEMFDLFLHLPVSTIHSVSKRWSVEGLQYIDSALARGEGAILVSAHFGYARLIEYILTTKGYKPHVVRSRSNSPVIKAEKRSKKQSLDFTAFGKFMYDRLRVPRIVTRDREFFAEMNVRPLVQALKNNNILFLMGDGTRAMKFVNLDFMRHILPFPTGFVSLAQITGAAILPIFAVDSPDGYGIKVIIEPPLMLEQSSSSEHDTTAKSVESFARLFESYVRRYPHLFYKMFARENKWEKRLARTQGDVAERYMHNKRRFNEKFSGN